MVKIREYEKDYKETNLFFFFSAEQTRLPCCRSKMVLSPFRGPGISLPAVDSG